jgi:hypothetical protein
MPRDEVRTNGMIGDSAAPLSLVDQLRVKRNEIARTANNRVRRYDRQIQLMEQTKSESIVRDAEELLSE